MSEPLAPTASLSPTAATHERRLHVGFPLKAALPWVLVGAFGVGTASLWLRLGHIQEQLAQQSAQATTASAEAKALAKAAADTSRDAAAKQTLLEAKLAEVSLQRSQLEELISSLSRSRDENLLEDIDSALRLAQQQAALTGSAEPLVTALKSAEQRIARAAQPRLNAVQRAIAKDLARLRTAAVVDVPGLLVKLDDAVRAVDDLPLANGVPQRSSTKPATAKSIAKAAPEQAHMGPGDRLQTWWSEAWHSLLQQSADLVRLSRIDAPDAALVAPEQAYMLRENLKLKLLNARMGVLARQSESARADVRLSLEHVGKYADMSSPKTKATQAQLQQALALMANTELPRPEDSLAALKLAGNTR